MNPKRGYELNLELKTKEFVQNLWGNSSAGLITAGYNEWLAAMHPITKEKVHFIGAWAMYPGGETATPQGKSSWFFVRYADGTYRLIRIWDEGNPLTNATNGLKGCRSIVPSPFPEEAGFVWYFCGFDLTGQGTTSVAGRKAWIYKGIIDNPNTGLISTPSIKLFPNPANDLITISGLQDDFKGTIYIYNSIGQMLLTEQKTGSQISIETGNLNSGIYFIKIKNENGEVITRKFIKQ